MTALLVGTVLAAVALAFVLHPLFARAPRESEVVPDETHSPAPFEQALLDAELDRATGKLSDADHEALLADYTRQSVAKEPRLPTEDAVEALILRYRRRPTSCASCGPRPEPDAIYCSSCGRYLAERCARCGAEVREPGARRCAACGHPLAA